jgi:hypothetical protein
MAAHDAWTILGNVAPADLSDATLELHWAVQYIPSAGQTFVEPRPDDSHRAMTWDAGLRAFVGESFAGAYPFRVAVRPEDLSLELIDRTGAALGTLPLAGKRRDEGYDWLSLGLANYMGGTQPEIERPEYELPPHPVADDAPFSDGRESERAVLAAVYGSAAELLGDVVAAHEGAAPVRCWPHHFDIATLITLTPADDAHEARTVGVGLAPMGGGYDSWYWYVTPWPYPEPEALPKLDGPGHWHTDGWVGAVLTGEEIVAAEPAAREGMVRGFLDRAIAAVTALVD